MENNITSSTSNRFETIFFDLGNTLIYSSKPWDEVLELSSKALTQQLNEQGFPLSRHDFTASFQKNMLSYQRSRDISLIEQPAEEILKNELSNYGFNDVPHSALRLALDKMFSISQKFWTPELDTLPTLNELKNRGYRLGVISNAKDSKDVHQLIDKARIRSYLESIIISSEIGFRKPHTQIFSIALDKMGIQAEQAVMIGDLLDTDILGAKNMNISNVWLTRRANSARNDVSIGIIKPDKTINALSELPDLLERW